VVTWVVRRALKSPVKLVINASVEGVEEEDREDSIKNETLRVHM